VDGLLSNSCIKGKVTSVQKLKHGLLQRRLYVKTRPSEKLDKFSSELTFEVTFFCFYCHRRQWSSTATAVFLLLDYEAEGPGRLGQLGRRGRVVFLFALGQRFLPTELKWL
jgi:hypothetical protein